MAGESGFGSTFGQRGANDPAFNAALQSAFTRLRAALPTPMSNTTAEGLAVRKVDTVPIDLATGNPVTAAPRVPQNDAANVPNKSQARLPSAPALAFTGSSKPAPPAVAAISNALVPMPAAPAAAPARPKPTAQPTVTLAQIAMKRQQAAAPPTRVMPASQPASNALQATRQSLGYDPRVDVTGQSQQHNAGGWGINAGGGIVP